MNQCTIFSCADPASPVPMARFALDAVHDGHLGYGTQYLQRTDAFALDPLHLPLQEATHLIPRLSGQFYGVLSDAGPNTWGVKLTHSLCRRSQRAAPVNVVEWLIHASHHGSGCLGFSSETDVPPRHHAAPESVSALDRRLLNLVADVAAGKDAVLDQESIRLLFPGASLGGVRPKTVVMHEGIEHIAKFSRLDDLFDVPAAEYCTMRLAHMAGIAIPDIELLDIADRHVFLVARFDRTPNGGRLHYISANTLINIATLSQDRHEYITKFSYAGIAELTRTLGDRPIPDSREVFRRMVFNILVGNVDDHLRNHGFVMNGLGNYVLTPAFDLVPHMDAMSTPQSIGVGAYGPASTMKNALSQCGRFYLKTTDAQRIIDEVREAVSHWRRIFREEGAMTEAHLHILEGCFNASEEAERVTMTIPFEEAGAAETGGERP
jgi:serine/threonine-protein kinase HipA